MNLTELFEPLPAMSTYDGFRDELKAVRSGRKGMSVFTLERDAVLEGDDEYEALAITAWELGLSVVHRSDPKLPIVRVFIVGHGEEWRIPAHELLWTMPGKWTWELEYLLCALLGYDDQQRTEWIDRRKSLRTAWGGKNVYVLMDESERALLEDTAMRCFSPANDLSAMTAFHCNESWVLKRDAANLLPRGKVICRATLKTSFCADHFGAMESKSSVIEASLGDDIRSVNRALVSDIQTWSSEGSGWL